MSLQSMLHLFLQSVSSYQATAINQVRTVAQAGRVRPPRTPTGTAGGNRSRALGCCRGSGASLAGQEGGNSEPPRWRQGLHVWQRAGSRRVAWDSVHDRTTEVVKGKLRQGQRDKDLGQVAHRHQGGQPSPRLPSEPSIDLQKGKPLCAV